MVQSILEPLPAYVDISTITMVASYSYPLVKKHMQVGARFQVLLEKEIHSAGNNVASKQ